MLGCLKKLLSPKNKYNKQYNNIISNFMCQPVFVKYDSTISNVFLKSSLLSLLILYILKEYD